MPQPTYGMLRDFMALPEQERLTAVQHPTLGPMLQDFLDAGGEGRRDILDKLRPASSETTPESANQEVSPFVEGLKRGTIRTGELLAERYQGQGENALNVLRALGPEARPFPGGNVVEKALNVARVPLAPAEAVLHPLGAAIQSATETVTKPFGVSRETASTASGILELLAGLGLSFAPTGTSAAATALRKFGLGRDTPAALEAERMQGVVREAAKGGFPELPLTASDIYGRPIAALPPAPPGATGGLPIFPGLSQGDIFEAQRNLTKRGAKIERQQVRQQVKAEAAAATAQADAQALEAETARRLREGGMPVAVPVTPAAETLNRQVGQAETARLQAQMDAERVAQQAAQAEQRALLNQGPPPSTLVEGRAPQGPPAVNVPMPTEDIGRLLREQRAAAEGRLPVPPGPTRATATVAELSKRIDTLKAAGEETKQLRLQLQALRKQGPEGEAVGGRPQPIPASKLPTPPVEATPAVAPEVTNRMQAIQYDAEHASGQPYGKQYGSVETEMGPRSVAIGDAKSFREQFAPLYPEFRNLPDVGPKEIATAIKKDENNKLYTIIKDAVTRQLENERVTPSAVSQRPSDFEAFSNAVDDLAAREKAATVPIRENPSTPSRIASSLERAGQEVAARKVQYRALTDPLPDGTNISGWTKQTISGDVFWMKGKRQTTDILTEAGQQAVDTAISQAHKVGSQPPLLRTQATMPPAPIQPKAPQVEHRDLLAGFKKAEPEPPRLPLGEGPKGTMEFGMGLPVRQIKERVRRFFSGEDAPGAQARWWQRSPTILNRALGKDPNGKGIGDKLYDARKITDQRAGQYDVAIQRSGLQSLTSQEEENLMRAYEGRAAPMNARVQTALSTLKPVTEGVGQRFEAKGAQVLRDAIYDTQTGAVIRASQWKPFQRIPNHYYRQVDPRLVVTRTPQQLAGDVLVANHSWTPVQAQEMATALLAQAKGEPIPTTVSDPIKRLLRQGQPRAGFLHERTGWTTPESILMRPKEAITRYLERAAIEEGFLDTFGPGDRIVETVLQKARQAGRRDVNLAQEEWDALRGRSVESAVGKGIRNVAQLGQNLATATLLGPKTALKQLSQIGMAFGSDVRARSLIQGATNAFSKQGKDAAKIAGAITDGVRADMELASHWRNSHLPSDTLLEKTVKLTGRVATAVVEKTRITAMDSIGRSFAFHGAKQDFLAYQRAAARGKLSAVTKLKEFGLTPTSTVQEVDTQASHLADQINLRADSLEIPAFFYRLPGLSALKHLNNFNMVMSRKIATQYMMPLGKAITEGNVREIARQLKRTVKFGAAMTVTGEVLGDTLTTISGKSDDRPGGSLWEFADSVATGKIPQSILLERLTSDLLTAGTFGYLQAIQGAIYAAGGAKEKQARLTGAVVGAPLGSLLEVGSHAAALATADREPNPQTGKSDFNQATQEAGRALFRRVPAVGSHLTDLLQSTGALPGSKSSEQRRTVEAIARAEQRPNASQTILDWMNWYEQRHGTPPSDKAMQRAREQYAP